MENEVRTAEDLEAVITKAHEAQAKYASYTQEQVDKISVKSRWRLTKPVFLWRRWLPKKREWALWKTR